VSNDLITLKQLRAFAISADKRLDDLEANSPVARALTLTKDGWVKNSGDDSYPYQYELMVENVTAESRADVEFDSASLAVAMACGVDARTETGAGKVLFRSFSAPATGLTGILYITKKAALNGT